MLFKGTKGPFRFKAWKNKRCADGIELVITDSRGHGIACLLTKGGGEKEVANAMLLAASKNLLEACIEAEKHHQGGHSDVGIMLRSAIDKALNG